MENDGEDGDDSYANAYLNDDDVDESEDAELAEMLAKVQSIQQVEGRLQPTETSVPATATDSKTNQAKEPAKVSARLSPRKRIETLSEPSKKTTPRKFATDDEEQHCRFQIRKKTQRAGSSRDDFDDGGDSSQSFISRMEAAERNRQKKLDLSRGENDYNARLDKKACPKCGLPQSYSEFKDKKKKCQMCGVEFRFLNAWGDIEHSFTSRMAETSRAQAERQEQIYAQMAAEATNRLKINKSVKQLPYEKQIAMKNNKQTFLDRNYTPNGDSKTKRAQLELEAKRKAARSAK
ncbi:hypothetical protein PPTG_17625 [Phytophthora nicotianae INRA-310]|uniref:Uncharacterized protein n=1 Tax=Phytophthora nicotianae (strain INRA-310) TaxID=761204 RepID=W2PMF6_PHYN3|nr:hypothetical protein PPTG_17625 [Phytophthora nicotianae INRA-310]ETN01215.1 hypothetical protein PPTG_17625 [Phytophthora nicotianae INRA-310]